MRRILVPLSSCFSGKEQSNKHAVSDHMFVVDIEKRRIVGRVQQQGSDMNAIQDKPCNQDKKIKFGQSRTFERFCKEQFIAIRFQ